MDELGGFAEAPSDIGGSQRDFEAYNFCLAEEYLGAILDEDWDALGNLDSYIIETIAYWLNYDDEIGKDIVDKIENIQSGLIITKNNRTFVDAIVACHKGNLAETFIGNGNHDVRLYLTAMFYGEDMQETLLNSIQNDFIHSNAKDFANFFNNIFVGIEEKYNALLKTDERINFLKKIKPFIIAITFPNEYREVMMSEKENLLKLKWYNDYKSK